MKEHDMAEENTPASAGDPGTSLPPAPVTGSQPFTLPTTPVEATGSATEPTQPIPALPTAPPSFPPPYAGGAAADAGLPTGWYPPPSYPPGYPTPGQHYGSYPPPSSNWIYPPPPPITEPPKSNGRWGLLLVAAVLAFVLGVGGYAFAGGWLGAAPEPTRTIPAAPSSSQTKPTTTSKAVTADQARGVVLIEAETAGGTAFGTGMVLTADGKVLTNYHVVAGTTKVAATIAASGDTYSATVLGFDQTRDVALLQLKNATGLGTVTLDRDPVNVGDAVAAVGNANGGMKLVKAPGSVTGTDQPLTVSSDSPWGNSEDLNGLVATNAGAVPGDSGGPMFDAQNEVLGMTTAGSTKEHASYAIPIATAVAIVNQIETGQDAGTVRVGPAGYLGVRVQGTSYTGAGSSTVESVVAGGPAEKAGITPGSRLTRIGDTTINDQTNVANVIRAIEPGQQVTVWWITPKGNTTHAVVTAGASPVN
jgi:S1-C subfamily serine protease